MKRKLFVLAAILAVALMAAPAGATTINAGAGFSTPVADGTTGTSVAFALNAAGTQLDVNIIDGVTTDKLNAILSSVLWTGSAFSDGTGTATAKDGVVAIPSGTVSGIGSSVSNSWAYAQGANGFGGNQGVSAMELGFFFPPALGGAKGNVIDGSAYSLVHNVDVSGAGLNATPYVVDEVDIVLNLANVPVGGFTTYDFSNVAFHYGTDPISGVPIPPSALLLGSGLLGLVGIGWRRKQD